MKSAMNYIGLVHGMHTERLFRSGESETTEIVWSLFQRLVAGVLLIILSPVFSLLYILVKGTSNGPFLFLQERVGLNDTVFTIRKIRTMEEGSEKSTALGITNSDPKVTKVGRILRSLKLDELPQLINIFLGNMVFVGPRPIPQKLDHELRNSISGFASRYGVLPGLTSIGQICVEDNGIGEDLVRDWAMRFEGEKHYMENRCVKYDMLMIVMTGLYVFKKVGTKGGRIK